MNWEYIRLVKEDNIAIVTLNRPAKFNDFAGRMRQGLLEAIEDAGADAGVRVVIITGAGKSTISKEGFQSFLEKREANNLLNSKAIIFTDK